MDSYEWIMYAGAAVWCVLGLYLAVLARRQALLSERVSRLNASGENGERGEPGK
ncbi:MAG: CcmD family protein [Desulfovibrio sp.]|nr:CcmD family protein [Desulfovibrio sp.]